MVQVFIYIYTNIQWSIYDFCFHRELDDRWSDQGSDISYSDTIDGRLIDHKVGTVKAKVADYRPGGYHLNTNQSNSHPTSSRIGQGRRKELDSLKKADSLYSMDPNANHLIYSGETQEVKNLWDEPRSISAVNAPNGLTRKQYIRSRSASGGRYVPAPKSTDYGYSSVNGSTYATAKVSRPVEKIYLPTGSISNDYYVIRPNAIGKQKYANSVIGAPKYDVRNRRH